MWPDNADKDSTKELAKEQDMDMVRLSGWKDVIFPRVKDEYL